MDNIYTHEKHVGNLRNTEDKYFDMLNKIAIEIGSLNLIIYNNDTGEIQEILMV